VAHAALRQTTTGRQNECRAAPSQSQGRRNTRAIRSSTAIQTELKKSIKLIAIDHSNEPGSGPHG
jgi:hypothetical protein